MPYILALLGIPVGLGFILLIGVGGIALVIGWIREDYGLGAGK